jgi:hypothetical protein
MVTLVLTLRSTWCTWHMSPWLPALEQGWILSVPVDLFFLRGLHLTQEKIGATTGFLSPCGNQFPLIGNVTCDVAFEASFSGFCPDRLRSIFQRLSSHSFSLLLFAFSSSPGRWGFPVLIELVETFPNVVPKLFLRFVVAFGFRCALIPTPLTDRRRRDQSP